MQAAELRIIYRPRCDATTEAEISALAAAYRFILNCHAQREVAEPAPEPDGRDDAKEAWLRPGGVLRGGETSVGAVVRMRGGDYVETSPVRTEQRAQEDQ